MAESTSESSSSGSSTSAQRVYGKGRADGGGGDSSTGSTVSRTTSDADTRTVTALMIFTVVFALIGNEVKSISAAAGTTAQHPNVKPGTDPITVGGRILVGGSIATTLLVMLSHAGRPGRQLALSLSVVAFFTSTLVYGGPVWTALSNALSNAPGAKPTGLTGSTTPTTATSPTAGTVPTVQALSNIVP